VEQYDANKAAIMRELELGVRLKNVVSRYGGSVPHLYAWIWRHPEVVKAYQRSGRGVNKRYSEYQQKLEAHKEDILKQLAATNVSLSQLAEQYQVPYGAFRYFVQRDERLAPFARATGVRKVRNRWNLRSLLLQEDLNYERVGQKLGVSRERVRQLVTELDLRDFVRVEKRRLKAMRKKLKKAKLLSALMRAKFDKEKAARMLGYSPNTLNQYLSEAGIKIERSRADYHASLKMLKEEIRRRYGLRVTASELLATLAESTDELDTVVRKLMERKREDVRVKLIGASNEDRLAGR